MFAQVACLVCGKLFQVPREKLGTSVACSWCGKPTDAVPVAVDVLPLPAATSDSTPQTLLQKGDREKVSRPLLWAGYAALLVAVAAVVFVGVRMLGGSVSLAEFVAPDGSCKALLPGAAIEAGITPDAATGELFPTGKRFRTPPGWGSKVEGEVGWFDVPEAKLVRPDDVFRALRDRRAGELGLTAEGEGVVRVNALQGVEVRFAGGNQRWVERYLFDPKASRPRVYWVGVGGPNFDPESEVAKKILGSLRVME
ncbi:MAG: hypothetical protein MUF18_08210 [Fimbriiglobus sp.]|jgi:hypothetical protein|nr:hypothetical protein [Fimbriiglobus sp.]